jgi:hypothetical protein
MAQISSISRVGTTEPFELQISRGQISGHFATAVGTSFTTPWELANTNTLPLISAASQNDQ